MEHEEYLEELRRTRDELKQQYEKLSAEYSEIKESLEIGRMTLKKMKDAVKDIEKEDPIDTVSLRKEKQKLTEEINILNRGIKEAQDRKRSLMAKIDPSKDVSTQKTELLYIKQALLNELSEIVYQKVDVQTLALKEKQIRLCDEILNKLV